MAEGMVTADGRFISYTDRIDLAVVYVCRGTTPEDTGMGVDVNQIVYDSPILKQRVPINLRKLADQIEKYQGN